MTVPQHGGLGELEGLEGSGGLASGLRHLGTLGFGDLDIVDLQDFGI